ncbi:MAG: hypothetical protein V4541_12075 [Bacteroidota bacterium]
MTVIDKLATSLNRRDEIPNQELATKIATQNDKEAVKELVNNLNHKDKGIQSDCIKTLDEIGKLKPSLISDHVDKLVALLDHKNNRLQWGAMAALHAITNENIKEIYNALPKIIESADKGSVITNDHCVGILIKLCAIKDYAAAAFILLNERLLKSPTNQLPMYAENALPVIMRGGHQASFTHTLSTRLEEIESPTKRARVEKVIKKLRA